MRSSLLLYAAAVHMQLKMVDANLLLLLFVCLSVVDIGELLCAGLYSAKQVMYYPALR